MCCTSCNKVARSESTSALHVNSQASFYFNPWKEPHSPPQLLIRKRKWDSTSIPCLSLVKFACLAYNRTKVLCSSQQNWMLKTSFCPPPPRYLSLSRERDPIHAGCWWSALSSNSTFMSKGALQDTRLPPKHLSPHQPLLYMLEAPCCQLRHASTSSSLSCRKTWVSCRITLTITLQPWILGEWLKMFKGTLTSPFTNVKEARKKPDWVS